MKRRAHDLEQLLRRLGRNQVKSPPKTSEDAPEGHRFSAKGLASHRKRLGIRIPAARSVFGGRRRQILQ